MDIVGIFRVIVNEMEETKIEVQAFQIASILTLYRENTNIQDQTGSVNGKNLGKNYLKNRIKILKTF